jgi:hypothetical protein
MTVNTNRDDYSEISEFASGSLFADNEGNIVIGNHEPSLNVDYSRIDDFSNVAMIDYDRTNDFSSVAMVDPATYRILTLPGTAARSMDEELEMQRFRKDQADFKEEMMERIARLESECYRLSQIVYELQMEKMKKQKPKTDNGVNVNDFLL